MTIEEIDALKAMKERLLRGEAVAAAPIPEPMEPTEPSGQPVETVAQPQARKGLPEGYVPSEAELLR